MKWLTSNKRLTHMVRDISSTLYELMASGERRLRQNRWECKLLTCRTWWISVSFNSAIFSCLCFPHLHPSYTQHSDNLMLIITMSNPLVTPVTHTHSQNFSLSLLKGELKVTLTIKIHVTHRKLLSVWDTKRIWSSNEL